MKTPDLNSNSHSNNRVIIIAVILTVLSSGIAGANPTAFFSLPFPVLKTNLDPRASSARDFIEINKPKTIEEPLVLSDIDRLNAEIQCLSMVSRSV